MNRPASRREFLSVGAVAGVGLTLADVLRIESARADQKNYDFIEAKAKSVIHIYLPGGAAQQELWDPKPFAPIEYRGDLKPIPTKVGGVQFSEYLKKTANVADKLCVIRSMSHGEAAHERGTHNMFTGYRPSPALKYPSMGSVVSHEYGPRNNLPPYVCVPNQPNEFAGTGYLSSSFAPFTLGSDPSRPEFQVRDLTMAKGVDETRFAHRRTALDAVNAYFHAKERSDAIDAMDTFYERAYNLISSKEAREAFNLNAESQKLREEYGMNDAGQRMLMAKRLVGAGVRFVSLTYGGWDMHSQIVRSIQRQVPTFDQAFAALITDLDRSGMLDDTLVMVSSEFGRTPKINQSAGRDHWPKVFSVVLAGGGIKKGMVYGSSNAIASEPDEDPVGPGDLATTMYNQLGIVADKELMAPGNRPIEIIDGGRVLKDILA
jgi:hypothetical protein